MRRSRQKLRARLGGAAQPLRLTSLMDVFTSLLLFLLKAFVAGGQPVTVTPGVRLPTSSAQAAPFDAPVLAVTAEFVALDGEQVMSSPAARAGADLKLEPLYAALVRLGAARAKDSSPRLVIQGDRDIEFSLLHRVMHTSQLAGFSQISLAVIQDESSLAELGSPAR